MDQSYSFAASNSWFSLNSQPSPNTYQGSATNPGCSKGGTGWATSTYFTVVGVQDSYAGDGAGPGFVTTDTTDPLAVTYRTKDAATGWGSFLNPTVLVNPYPLNYPSPPLPQQFQLRQPRGAESSVKTLRCTGI